MNIRPLFVVGAAYLLWEALSNRSKIPLGPMDEKRAFVLAIWEAAGEPAQREGWPRDIIITAAAHESNYGKSNLAAKYKNLFGFKANRSWLAAKKPVAMLPTWEVIDGKHVKIKAAFRAYPSWKESIEDYISLIQRLSRYEVAEQAALRGDFKGFFEGLQKGGYATDPLYAKKLGTVHRSVESLIV